MVVGKFLLLFLLGTLVIVYATHTRGSYKLKHAEITLHNRHLMGQKQSTGGYQMMCRGMMCSHGNSGGGGSYNGTSGKGMGMRYPDMSVFQLLHQYYDFHIFSLYSD